MNTGAARAAGARQIPSSRAASVRGSPHAPPFPLGDSHSDLNMSSVRPTRTMSPSESSTTSPGRQLARVDEGAVGRGARDLAVTDGEGLVGGGLLGPIDQGVAVRDELVVEIDPGFHRGVRPGATGEDGHRGAKLDQRAVLLRVQRRQHDEPAQAQTGRRHHAARVHRRHEHGLRRRHARPAVAAGRAPGRQHRLPTVGTGLLLHPGGAAMEARISSGGGVPVALLHDRASLDFDGTGLDLRGSRDGCPFWWAIGRTTGSPLRMIGLQAGDGQTPIAKISTTCSIIRRPMSSTLPHTLLALVLRRAAERSRRACRRPRAAPRSSPPASPSTSGRTVVLWNDEQGFDGYQTRCIDQTGGCCDFESERYGVAQGPGQSHAGEPAGHRLAVRAALRRLRELPFLLQVDAQPHASGRRHVAAASRRTS